MTLTKLQFFVEAAQRENFTEAAEALFVSQPALSKQIALFEREVGAPLFERRGRGVRLTAAGQYLYRQLKDVPALVARSVEQAQRIGRGGAGALRIGILEGQELNPSLLARLQMFYSMYPEVDVALERNGFKNLRAGLENGHYDMIITLSFELGHIKNARHEIVFSQRGAIAMNRRHPLAGSETVTLAMLADEDFLAISPAESAGGHGLFLKQCEACGFTPRIVRQLSTLESLLLGVEAGMGIAVIDRNTRLEKNEEVCIFPLDNSDASHTVAVWPATSANIAVQNLGRALKET